MGSNIKTGNEARKTKAADTIINDNSDAREKAAAAIKADLEARAKAVGLKKSATQEEIEQAEFEAAEKSNSEEIDRQSKLREKNPKLWALQSTINKVFEDRAQTSLPKLTETEIKAMCGKAGASVSMKFNFNDDKTKGHIVLSEFDSEARCPVSGEFDFGFDYAAAAKEASIKVK